MKVKELIKKLKKESPEASIVLFDGDYTFLAVGIAVSKGPVNKTEVAICTLDQIAALNGVVRKKD